MKRKKLFFAFLISCLMVNAQTDQNSEIRFNQYGKAVERKIIKPEARNGILVFESTNQDYRVWFDIRIQTDAQTFFGDNLNKVGDGISIRRARFAVKAQVTQNWYGEIDLDFSNGVAELKDAIIAYDFRNGLETRIGNFKEQFSMSQTTTSRYLTFMERSMVNSALVPSRHIGWGVSYDAPWFLALGGIHFQEVSDLETRTYVEDNNKDYGRDEGYSLTGKLVLQPFASKQDYGLHFAGAYSYRTKKNSIDPAHYDKIRFDSRALSTINRKKYLDTDRITDYDHHQLSNIEFAAHYKAFAFQSEFIDAYVTRINGKEPLHFNGFYLQGRYMLFGGKQCYNKGEGEFTQPTFGKKWGDIELAFRYDYLNLNSKDVMGGAGEGYTLGVNFYANNNVKFQVNYSYVNMDRYANGRGSLFVGHDSSGNLTKDPTKVVEETGKAGNQIGMLGLRCEIDF